ncbi:hypothetical protein HID58_073843 [Brassica napus]|uniref:Uncharacterized protein n=1 Tax=Brassica napus TaxID=3708 RepID=A0ABQ7YF86_BRANA|nr:hypothetical protein HID58_073843 [Brassica napus]
MELPLVSTSTHKLYLWLLRRRDVEAWMEANSIEKNGEQQLSASQHSISRNGPERPSLERPGRTTTTSTST